METEKFTEEQIVDMARALGVSLDGGITEEVKNQIAERLAVVLLEMSHTAKKF
jgi:hypothetical protein